jgi:sugar-specific transcriptional regulator TrmB
MLIPTLQQLGLSEKQAKIYLACLELGETSIKEIAQKSGIKRTTIYDLIDDMVNAGYIRTTKKGKKVRYIATEPEDLKIIMKQREALLREIIPELTLINNVSRNKPKIWFYEGIEGIKKVYEDLLKFPNTEVCGWGSEDSTTLLGTDYCNDYVKRRTAKKIKLKIIYPLTEITKYYKENDKSQYRQSRTVDPKKFAFRIEINIYNNRVLMVSAKDQMAVIIESEPIAETWKNIFKMCWEK